MIKRQKLLSTVFLLAFVILVVRLFYWQVIKAKELSEQARRQYQVGAQIQAPRGNILASDETWLAGKVEGWVLYASIPHIKLDGKRIINLGDTLLHEKEWETIQSPDVLMIPIGGKAVHNTMDEEEALQAVKIMRPKLVIPCHYNCPAFFSKKYNPADDQMFKIKVQKTGAKCVILGKGDSVDLANEESEATGRFQ